MSKRLKPEEKVKPGPKPGQRTNITPEGRERMKTAQRDPRGLVYYQEWLAGAKPTAISKKHGVSRNSVVGHIWRYRREAAGLARSPHHVKHTVTEQPQRRSTVTLPLVGWIARC